MKKIALASLLLFFSSFAHSAIETADQLVRQSQSSEGWESFGATMYVLGFLRGVHLVQGFYAYPKGLNQRKFICHPDGLTVGILQKIFIKYVEDNPAKLTDPAEHVLFEAMFDTYPCK